MCEIRQENMRKKTDYLYIGMDVHKETHTAVLMTYMEERVGEIEIQNNLRGFQRLTTCVEKCQKKKQHEKLTPLYGLEDVTHFGRNLAIYLLEKSHIVKEVNSALSYMERMSYPTMKKNDTWDAQCVCAVLMRRYEILPDADPKDYYWTMKQLVHRRNALVKTKSALLQQFHDQIQYDYPSYKKFFTDMECNTSIAFFERYPSSRTLEHTTVEELAEFLRIPSHNACSTKRAEKILDLIEADAVEERNYQSGRDFIIQSMMRNIRFILEE